MSAGVILVIGCALYALPFLSAIFSGVRDDGDLEAWLYSLPLEKAVFFAFSVWSGKSFILFAIFFGMFHRAVA